MKYINAEHTRWWHQEGDGDNRVTRSGTLEDQFYIDWCAEHGEDSIEPYTE